MSDETNNLDNPALAEAFAALEKEEAELLALVTDSKVAHEAKLTAIQKAFRDRKKQEEKRFNQATDSEYWFAVCFLTRNQKETFLQAFGWDALGDKYIDGVALSAGIGIELPSEELRFVDEKPDKRLNEISLPLEKPA